MTVQTPKLKRLVTGILLLSHQRDDDSGNGNRWWSGFRERVGRLKEDPGQFRIVEFGSRIGAIAPYASRERRFIIQALIAMFDI